MSKFHLIGELLNQLVETPDIAASARKVGVSERQVHNWTVQSRGGKAELQEIEFMGVVAPFHIHRENARRLSVDALEAAFLDRCRNGFYVGSYYKGEPVWQADERIVASGIDDPEMLTLLFGQSDKFLRVDGRRQQVLQHMKPSEQAVQAALQHWRNYAQHIKTDVSVGGVLRVDSAEPTKLIEQKRAEAFEDSSAGIEADQAGNFLAVHREAKTQDEMTMWQKNGVFAPATIDFEAEDGTVTSVKQDIAPPAAARAAPPEDKDMPDPIEMTTASKTPEAAGAVASWHDRIARRLIGAGCRSKANGPAHPSPSRPVQKFYPTDEPPPPPDPQAGVSVPANQRADRASVGRGAQNTTGGIKTV